MLAIIVGEIGDEFARSMVIFAQVLIMYISRYIGCTQTPRMRRILTQSNCVTIVWTTKNRNQLLKFLCKLKKRLKQVVVHMLVGPEPS